MRWINASSRESPGGQGAQWPLKAGLKSKSIDKMYRGDDASPSPNGEPGCVSHIVISAFEAPPHSTSGLEPSYGWLQFYAANAARPVKRATMALGQNPPVGRGASRRFDLIGGFS